MKTTSILHSFIAVSALAFLSFAFFGCATTDNGSSGSAAGKSRGSNEDAPKVVISTSMGDITVELDVEKAPLTVTNFLRYVDSNFYDRTLVHRVERSVLIEAGGYDVLYNRKQTKPSIPNEADNGLRNRRGTISMARGKAASSATSRFFINLDDNEGFDYDPEDPKQHGYAVFGRVTKGISVADRISKVEVKAAHGLRDTPAEVVAIKTIRRVK